MHIKGKPMKKKYNASLLEYNTFGVAASTPVFVEVKSILSLQKILKDKTFKDALILGGGSNVLFAKDLLNPVIKISIAGIRIINESKDIAIVSAGAGVVWHDLVMWWVAKGLGGIENLSLIPGLVGAAPIQNIGAYGVELSDVFYDAVCVNRKTMESRIFNAKDCDFGYRESAFKNDLEGQYVVTALYADFGIESPSAPVTVTTSLPEFVCAGPQNLTAEALSNNVELRWDAPEGGPTWFGHNNGTFNLSLIHI